MYTKFFEEFTKATEGKYPMLKLCGAKYIRSKNLLNVNFIISAFEIQQFSDEQKADVLNAVQSLFPGIDVAVSYTRTYADNAVVKNKILEFLNKNNQMLFRSINDENTVLNISDDLIDITFKLDTPIYKMFETGTLCEDMADFLDKSFNQTISIGAEECVSELQDDDFEFITSGSAVADVSGLRLIRIDVGEKAMSRSKVDGVSQMPGYIADVKSEAKNCVLCGKISNISKRFYNNKKYNPDDKKSGPEKLPMIKFMIDDSTGKMDCTCFPRQDDADDLETMLNTTPEVVCTGDISRYNGALSMTASAVFACSIDYNSINTSVGKPVPSHYNFVYPQNYVSMSQQSLIDDGADKISEYLIGKTYVIFDLETTSKFPDTADIIQLSALKVIDGVEKQTFTTFVKPPKSIPAEITELTGIDDDMVAAAPKIADVLPDFYKFANGAILAGHNIIGYDYPIIARFAEPMGYKFNNDLLDTLILSRKYLTEMSNHKLTTLSKALKIDHENAHRSDADVLATWGVLKEVAKRIDLQGNKR